MRNKIGATALAVAAMGAILPVQANAAKMVIYSDSLQAGWQSWSWATVNLSAKPAHTGKASIGVSDPKGWEALAVHHATFSTRGYSTLSFWISGGNTGGQTFLVAATVNNKAIKQVVAGPAPAHGWVHVFIPLTALKASGKSIDGFWIQNGTGKPMRTAFVDDITLTK